VEPPLADPTFTPNLEAANWEALLGVEGQSLEALLKIGRSLESMSEVLGASGELSGLAGVSAPIGGVSAFSQGPSLSDLMGHVFRLNALGVDFGATIGAPLGESVDLLGSIDTNIARMAQVLGNGKAVPLQVNVNLNGPIGAGADLAAIENAARRGTLEAIDEGLYDLQLERRQALGDVRVN
jgi:hypothetical protein